MKIFWIFVEQGKIMEAEEPTVRVGATPSEQMAPHPYNPSHFYTGCPSCRNPPNLSWLGTGTDLCWLAYPVAWFAYLVAANAKGLYSQPRDVAEHCTGRKGNVICLFFSKQLTTNLIFLHV